MIANFRAFLSISLVLIGLSLLYFALTDRYAPNFVTLVWLAVSLLGLGAGLSLVPTRFRR